MRKTLLIPLCVLLLFCANVFGEIVAPNGAKELENYRTSWIGNSFGGMKDGRGHWVQQDIAAICVTEDGTVYTNIPWEEAGGNCSMYKDGEMLGHANHTHGWGFNGGKAVAVNKKYVYIALSGNNEGGGLVDPDTWPPKGYQWYGISRRLRSDFTKGAPFEHGKGGKGDTLPKSFLVVNEVPLDAKDENGKKFNPDSAAITGLWADEERLYVSNPHTNSIEIYDAETMKMLDSWCLSNWDKERQELLNPGQIAMDKNGDLWIMHQETTDEFKDFANTISRFNKNGERLDPFFSDIGSPMTYGPFCIGPDNTMYIYNDYLRAVMSVNIDEFIKKADAEKDKAIFERSGSEVVRISIPEIHPRGEFGDMRILGKVSALGCDAEGNLYIAQNLASSGGGNVLESYRLNEKTETALKMQCRGVELRWRLFGLCFIDCASLDPEDETIVWTKEEKFKMDWTQTEPGKEWSFLASTYYGGRDMRKNIGDSSSVWARSFGDNKYLYVLPMSGDTIQIYQLLAAPDDVAKTNKGIDNINEKQYENDPSLLEQIKKLRNSRDGHVKLRGFFSGRKPKDFIGKNVPDENCAWIWNGYTEKYSLASDSKPEPSTQAVWVDSEANVWKASERNGITRFLATETEQDGIAYSYENTTTFPHAKEFTHVKRIRYDVETDTLYLGGCAVVDGIEHKNQHWKPMGPVVCRYDNFLKGENPGNTDGKLVWKIVLPYMAGSRGHESCEPMGFDIAGEYMFVPYTGASKADGIKTGHIEVYRLKDGSSIGWMEPDRKTVGEIGLQDIRECLSAHQRKNGEYVIFLEDDYKAKVVMFRWPGERESRVENRESGIE